MNHWPYLVIFYILILGTLNNKALLVDIGEICVKSSKFGGKVVKSLNSIGVLGCGKYCAQHGSCSGFNYHPGSLLCELADDVNRKGTDDEGWYSCKVIGYILKLIGPCGSPEVANGHYCVVLSNGKSKRVIDQCLKTPSIKDGRITITNRSVGSHAHLSCNSGHQAVGKPGMTCLPSGEWSSTQFTCIVVPILGQPEMEEDVVLNTETP